MIDVSNENVPRYFLLLEMAFYTQRGIALIQQSLIDGAVWRMTNGTPLPQRLMLIDKRAALLRVTFEAGFVFAQERKATGFEFLLNICGRAFNRDPFVHLVTIRAAHFAFEHGMMMRQRECCANFQVALETGFRRLSRIYDGAGAATGFHVQAPRPMAGLAAHIDRHFWGFAALCAGLTDDNLFCLQSRVGGCAEIAHDLFVAGRTFF